VFADWLEVDEPDVADHDDELDVESELELAVAIASEVEDGLVPELLPASDVDEPPEELFVDEAAEVSLADFRAQLVPRPRKVEMLSSPASTRERAAACRLFLGRCDLASARLGGGRPPVARPWGVLSFIASSCPIGRDRRCTSALGRASEPSESRLGIRRWGLGSMARFSGRTPWSFRAGPQPRRLDSRVTGRAWCRSISEGGDR